MILGGLGGVLMDRLVFPYLSSLDFFSKYAFLKKSKENTTFINKTEQIYIKDDESIIKLTNQVASSVVSVLSYPDSEKQKYSKAKNEAENFRKGTGLVVTSDGLIMIHSSIVSPDNTEKYKVLLPNGNDLDADLVGIDLFSGLAFLKVNASNLSSVSFSDSSNIKAGQRIISIGSGNRTQLYRFGFGVLSFVDELGSVSGKSVYSSEKMQGIFELDLDLETDFSGGPVIDYAGQVVGVIGEIKNSEKIDFFALPSNKVKKVIEKAIRGELDKSASLGIYFVPLTHEYAIQNSLKRESGALIYSASGQRGLAIISGSPADKAGLQLGDIIIQINDREITLNNPLPNLLYDYKKGDTITLKILRNDKETEIKVNL